MTKRMGVYQFNRKEIARFTCLGRGAGFPKLERAKP
jgi:hypothetical protein